MADQSLDDDEREGHKPATKQPYRRPELRGLGSLRDITMSNSGGGASDGGMPPRNGTKRGGNFESCDAEG